MARRRNGEGGGIARACWASWVGLLEGQVKWGQLRLAKFNLMLLCEPNLRQAAPAGRSLNSDEPQGRRGFGRRIFAPILSFDRNLRRRKAGNENSVCNSPVWGGGRKRAGCLHWAS